MKPIGKILPIAHATIPIIYLISTRAFVSAWSGMHQSLAIFFDLTPGQMRLLPAAMNLIVSCFGIPSAIRVFRMNARNEIIGRPGFLLALACFITVCGLCFSAVRWILTDREAAVAGLRDTFRPSVRETGAAAKIRDGLFLDDGLGFSVRLPEKWELLSDVAVMRAHASGSRSIDGEDLSYAETRLPPGIRQFLVLKKHPEAYSGYNPSIGFVSYEKKAMQDSGFRSLEEFARQWDRIGPPLSVTIGAAPERIGDFEGYRVRLEGNFDGLMMRQHILAFETAEHYITVTISYQEASDRAKLEDSIKSIRRME